MITKLKKHHVEREENEGHPDNGGDGYWIYLKAGFKWAGDPIGCLHSIHEDTKREAYSEYVMPCDCAECSSEK